MSQIINIAPNRSPSLESNFFADRPKLSHLIAFLEFEDQEKLRVISKTLNKAVQEHQRRATIAEIPDFVAQLLPSGRTALKRLTFQKVRTLHDIEQGSAGRKPIVLEYGALKASMVVGIEVNDRENQGPRPFFAFGVQTYREPRLLCSCLGPLTVEKAVQVFYKHSFYPRWGSNGPVPIVGSQGNLTYTRFTNENPQGLGNVKSILVGESIVDGQANVKCNFCVPRCCPETPCAPFKAVLYKRQINLGLSPPFGLPEPLPPAPVDEEMV